MNNMINKKRPPSMDVWMSLTVALNFRDKAIKIIQYGSLILQWYYFHGSKDTKAKILAARMGASMARKGFRLFRTLNHVCAIANLLNNWRELVATENREGRNSPISLICREDSAIDLASFSENLFYGLYYWFDNILYLGRTKIIEHDDLLNCDRANIANWAADVSSLVGSLLKFRKTNRCKKDLQEKIRQLKQQMQQQQQQQQQQNHKQHLQQQYELSDAVDVCRCGRECLKKIKGKNGRDWGEEEDVKVKEVDNASLCAICDKSLNDRDRSVTPPTIEESNDSHSSSSSTSSTTSSSSSSALRLHPSTPSNATHTPTNSTDRRDGIHPPFYTVASVAQSPTQKKTLFAPTPSTPLAGPPTTASSSTSSLCPRIVSLSDLSPTRLEELEMTLVQLSNDQDRLVVECLISTMEVLVSSNFSPMNFWAKVLGPNRFNEAHEGLCGCLSSIFVIYNMWPNRSHS